MKNANKLAHVYFIYFFGNIIDFFILVVYNLSIDKFAFFIPFRASFSQRFFDGYFDIIGVFSISWFEGREYIKNAISTQNDN